MRVQAPARVQREEEAEGGIVAPKSPLRCAIRCRTQARHDLGTRAAASASLRFADAPATADSDTLTR